MNVPTAHQKNNSPTASSTHPTARVTECVAPVPKPAWKRITRSQARLCTVAFDQATLTSHVMPKANTPNTTTGRANDFTCRHNTINPRVSQARTGERITGPGNETDRNKKPSYSTAL